MYLLEFRLEGLPNLITNERCGWKVKWARATRWKQAVLIAVRSQANYQEPPKLEKAMLTLTRHSSQEPDFDNMVSSFKYIIDGLVQAQVISNDRSANIGQPQYLWKQAPAKQGYVTIKVEEISLV